MFCNKCGKQLADGSKFCIACGNRLATVNVQPTNTQSINEQSPYAPTGAGQQVVSEQVVAEKKPFFKKPAGFISIGAAAAAIVVAIVLVVINVSPEKKVLNAFADTIELMQTSNVLDQELGMSAIMEKVQNESMAHDISVRVDSEGADVELKTDVKNGRYAVTVTPISRYLSNFDIEVYADKENLMAGCQSILDDYLYVNYEGFVEDFENSSLYSLLSMATGYSIGSQDSAASNESGTYATQGNSLFSIMLETMDDSKDLVEECVDLADTSWNDFLDSFEYESADENYTLKGEKTDSYKVTISKASFRELIMKYADFIKTNTTVQNFILETYGESFYNSLIEELDEEVIEELDYVLEFFPDSVEIYIFLLDGYVVKAEAEVNIVLNSSAEEGTAKFSMILTGDENVTDEIQINASLTDNRYGEEVGITFTMNNNASESDNTAYTNAEIIFWSSSRDWGYSVEDGYSMYMEYNRQSGYCTWTGHDLNYNDYFSMSGRFSNITKGSGFTFTFDSISDGYYNMDADIVYSIAPCDAVKPFVDYGDAVNVLDIDMAYISKLSSNLMPYISLY